MPAKDQGNTEVGGKDFFAISCPSATTASATQSSLAAGPPGAADIQKCLAMLRDPRKCHPSTNNGPTVEIAMKNF